MSSWQKKNTSSRCLTVSVVVWAACNVFADTFCSFCSIGEQVQIARRECLPRVVFSLLVHSVKLSALEHEAETALHAVTVRAVHSLAVSAVYIFSCLYSADV
jgi:hypothetical protein